MEHDSTEKKDTVFRVLHLFCGKPRKSDLRAWLTRLAPGFKCTVHAREVDIARSSEDDLSGEGLWQKFSQRLQRANGMQFSCLHPAIHLAGQGIYGRDHRAHAPFVRSMALSIWFPLGFSCQQTDSG